MVENGNGPHPWGVGDPSLPPRRQTGSWAYAILPYLEQEAVFQKRAWTSAFAIYVCPSRRIAEPQEAPAADQYGSYLAGGWAWGKTDYAANFKAIPNRPKCYTLAVFTDGTSQTILVGEKSVDPNNYATGTWFWDEPFFLGGAGGTEREGTKILKDVRGVYFAYNWGSAHSGGAQFLFADGHVQLLAYGTAESTVKALLTPNGDEVVPEF
jgi:prepilin-type processing-associated H-X9-DG protein